MATERKRPDGLREALRALALDKRRPTERDRPPPSTFEGRKVKPLVGQLDLYGNEVEQ